MERKVQEGLYKKYEADDAGGDIGLCARRAWEMAWSDHKSGQVSRAFSADYESTVPAQYTKDGRAHCYLYIAVRPAEKG